MVHEVIIKKFFIDSYYNKLRINLSVENEGGTFKKEFKIKNSVNEFLHITGLSFWKVIENQKIKIDYNVALKEFKVFNSDESKNLKLRLCK